MNTIKYHFGKAEFVLADLSNDERFRIASLLAGDTRLEKLIKPLVKGLYISGIDSGLVGIAHGTNELTDSSALRIVEALPPEYKRALSGICNKLLQPK
jgi:hypothetical protein